MPNSTAWKVHMTSAELDTYIYVTSAAVLCSESGHESFGYVRSHVSFAAANETFLVVNVSSSHGVWSTGAING